MKYAKLIKDFITNLIKSATNYLKANNLIDTPAKKLALLLLGLGGVLIVALLGFLLYASYTLKSSLETSINSYLASIKEDIPTLEYEPFVCSGVANISCATRYITLAGEVQAREVSLGFGSLGDKKRLNAWIETKEVEFIKDTSTHSLLRVFFALPKVDLSDILFPTYGLCELENILLDSSDFKVAKTEQNTPIQNPKIDSRTHITHIAKCNLKAQNMNYTLKAQAEQSLEPNQNKDTQNIKDILLEIYDSYTTTPNAFMEESRIWIDSISLNLKPNKLDSTIAQWLEKLEYGKSPDEKSTKEQAKALKERFDKAITESANIATYTFSFVSSNKDTRRAIMEGVNSFSNLLQGESAEVRYELLPKHTRYFRLSDLVSAPSAVLNLANFALKVEQTQKSKEQKATKDSSDSSEASKLTPQK